MLDWRDRMFHARDRLLANARFQKRAATLPGSRLIARNRARQLFDLCAGFVYSQTLLACVKLRLFDILLEGPQSSVALAERLSLSEDSCARLLTAAAGLNLVEPRSHDRYGLGPLGAALAKNPSLTAMIEHHRHLYADLHDPVALLRAAAPETELGRYWPYANTSDPARLSDEHVAEYSQLMALSQPLLADEVLDAYPMRNHSCLLDVGGGEGTFLSAAAQQAPGLRLMLFDLPAVARRAEASLQAAGLAQRVQIFYGDFFRDPLPLGADVITLVRIALDHEDAKVLLLLHAIRAALPENGVLIVAEPMIDARSGDAMAAAYFGMYLMAMGRGRPRSREEHAGLARSAGFSQVSFRSGRQVLGTSVMIARR